MCEDFPIWLTYTIPCLYNGYNVIFRDYMSTNLLRRTTDEKKEPQAQHGDDARRPAFDKCMSWIS